jgi:hypothetical protein
MQGDGLSIRVFPSGGLTAEIKANLVGMKHYVSPLGLPDILSCTFVVDPLKTLSTRLASHLDCLL